MTLNTVQALVLAKTQAGAGERPDIGFLAMIGHMGQFLLAFNDGVDLEGGLKPLGRMLIASLDFANRFGVNAQQWFDGLSPFDILAARQAYGPGQGANVCMFRLVTQTGHLASNLEGVIYEAYQKEGETLGLVLRCVEAILALVYQIPFYDFLQTAFAEYQET